MRPCNHSNKSRSAPSPRDAENHSVPLLRCFTSPRKMWDIPQLPHQCYHLEGMAQYDGKTELLALTRIAAKQH